MKICVYAIAKNEEQFVDRWMDSMREADWVCVLDTGSTDRTVEKLADRGAIVCREIIEPWRFDAARNRSMDLIPQRRFPVCPTRPPLERRPRFCANICQVCNGGLQLAVCLV